MNQSEFVGVWSLKTFSISFSDGRPPIYPFGEDAEGLIVYTECGMMSALLSKANRPKFSTTRIEDTSRASVCEKVKAFDSYLHYAGFYRIEGNEVVHTINHALDPSIIGNEQRRFFSYDKKNKILTLSYDIVAKSNVNRHYSLSWISAKRNLS